MSESFFHVAQIHICMSHMYKDHTERRLCILKLKQVIVSTRCSDCQILWQEWKQPPPQLKMQCLRVKTSLYSLRNLEVFQGWGHLEEFPRLSENK